MSVRCLVADDHPAMVVAVAEYLAQSGYEVVGPAADGDAAVAMAAGEQPQVALVDYHMPRLAGQELLRRLADVAPSTLLVVYTAEADAALARDILAAGAHALVLKEAPLADVVRALAAVLAGQTYVDPGVGGPLGGANGKSAPTPRELEVLAHLADGLTHEEIGRRLGISSETVRAHARKVAGRLGAKTRTQAVATALRQGLIG